MKLVREHINEKFTKDSDPIKDLNIGIFSHHNFHTLEEAIDFLYSALPVIIKKNKIPKDIIEIGSKSYKWDYYYDIKHYVFKYININSKSIERHGKYAWIDIYNALRKKLLDNGFGKIYDNKQTKNPYLNEKFTQNSDPIKDMEIGILNKYFTIHINRVGSYVFTERSPDFVKDNLPTKYIYTKSGNIYRNHPHLWLPQEIRSGSFAFHKGNPKKMPAKDLEEAKETVLNHYLNIRKREGLKF